MRHDYPQPGSAVRLHSMGAIRVELADDASGVPRLALTKAEAASCLGVSIDFFEQHVMPSIRIVRVGRRRLIPIGELQAWLDGEARRTVD